MRKNMKILISSVDAGSGHNAVRDSLYDQLENIEGFEVIKHKIKSQSIDKVYKTLMNNFQPLNQAIYDFSEMYIAGRVSVEVSIDIYLECVREIKETDPDVIIATYPTLGSLYAKARSQLNHHSKIITAHPDYGPPHRTYFPSSEKYQADQLWVTSKFSYNGAPESCYVTEEKLKLIGILPAKEFLQSKKQTPIEARNELIYKLPDDTVGNLKPELPTLLLIAGGSWIYYLEDFFELLQKNHSDEDAKFQILVICGKDKKFHEKLYKKIIDNKLRIPTVVLGFVPREVVSLSMQSADIAVLGSYGAGILKETAFSRIPNIYVHNILGGPEHGNLEYGLKHDFVKYEQKAEILVEEVLDFFDNFEEEKSKETVRQKKFDKFIENHKKWSENVPKLITELVNEK